MQASQIHALGWRARFRKEKQQITKGHQEKEKELELLNQPVNAAATRCPWPGWNQSQCHEPPNFKES